MNKNDFYNGNPNLPKAFTKKNFSEHEQAEYIRCMNDPVYFGQTYFKIVHQRRGLIPMELYPYQIEAIEKFQKKNKLIMATARQVGKALALDTAIPLYNGGFATIRDLKIGDKIIGVDGKSTNVLFKSEIYNKPTYKITFDDKSEVIACEDHIWSVFERKYHTSPEQKDITTKQLFSTFKKNEREFRYFIKNVKPVDYRKRDLKLDPYVLGLWLGDGTSASGGFTSTQEDLDHYNLSLTDMRIISEKSKAVTVTIAGISPILRSYNLLNNKHIPDDYLYSSIEDRIRLLQGIVDTDGFVGKNGIIEISFDRKRYPKLIQDLYQLVTSLGLKVTKGSRFNKKYQTWSDGIRFTVSREQFDPCTLPRKLKRVKEKLTLENYVLSRTIQNVELVESVPTQCITVDAPDHLFVIGKEYIPTHNTTIATVVILWIALFNEHKNIAILANKEATAKEVLSRIQLAYEHLPDFLKGGVKEWNKKSVEFENGCKIFADATSGSSARGKSLFLLYIDECAHVEGWDDFAASVLPTISASTEEGEEDGEEAKLIFTSTPNGLNHFYNYYKAAAEENGEFGLVEVHWTDVPGRGEKWRAKALADLNYDEQKFEQEYCVGWLGSSGTLISGAVLKLLKEKDPYWTDDKLKMYYEPIEDHIYAIVADVSRGKGLDYSAFSVIDITKVPYIQVCTFRCNKINATDYAAVIDQIGKHYNKAYVLVELNDNGLNVSDTLHFYHEYDNMIYTASKGRAGKKITFSGKRDKVDRGLMTTIKTKSAGCAMLKMLVEQFKLELNDYWTIEELKTFSAKETTTDKLTYAAEEGKHDDTSMALVLFGWLASQETFKHLSDTHILQELRELTEEEIEDYMMPIGIINNGIDPLDDDLMDNQLVTEDQFETFMKSL